MSSNSSSISLIQTLSAISPQINRYLSIAILLFGIIGNVLNCLALSQRNLRTNPCGLFFLTSSVANLVTLVSGVAVRLLAGWSADLTDIIDSLCKIRIFILFSWRTMAIWLITMATVDRWISSLIDANRRQMSSLKNAHRTIILIVILSSLMYSYIFYCYEANLTNAPVKCYGKTIWCRILIDIMFAFLSVIIPSMVMLIFGFLAVINIRQSALRRVQPMTLSTANQTQIKTNSSNRSKKLNYYLHKMLIIQVILLTLFSLPQAIHSLYANITRTQIKSPLENAISNFVLNLFFLLTYITNGMPFYIYTLSGGAVFRKALTNSIREIIRKIRFQRQ